MFRAEELFTLAHSLAAPLLARQARAWDAIEGIGSFVAALGPSLDPAEYVQRAPGVWAHTSAKIAESACVCAPCVIGPETEVRHAAYIRGGALIGGGCIVGNSVEIKNAILFDGVQACHFNYVGDSILGWRAHLGAGAVTSNFKQDGSEIWVRSGEFCIPTGMQKFGALLGDGAEIGCNAVLNPGSIVGRASRVYPLCSVRGVLPERSILKSSGEIAPLEPRGKR